MDSSSSANVARAAATSLRPFARLLRLSLLRSLLGHCAVAALRVLRAVALFVKSRRRGELQRAEYCSARTSLARLRASALGSLAR